METIHGELKLRNIVTINMTTPEQLTIPLNKSFPGIKALQNERNENIELRQENVDLTQDKRRLSNLLEEKDRNNAQLKSELKDIKSYLRQIREGAKKFL